MEEEEDNTTKENEPNYKIIKLPYGEKSLLLLEKFDNKEKACDLLCKIKGEKFEKITIGQNFLVNNDLHQYFIEFVDLLFNFNKIDIEIEICCNIDELNIKNFSLLLLKNESTKKLTLDEDIMIEKDAMSDFLDLISKSYIEFNFENQVLENIFKNIIENEGEISNDLKNKYFNIRLNFESNIYSSEKFKDIHFSYCFLNDENMDIFIDKIFKKNKEIKTLWLNNNYISSKGSNKLFDYFVKNEIEIENIYMINNLIDKKSIDCIINFIFNSNTISYIDIRNTTFDRSFELDIKGANIKKLAKYSYIINKNERRVRLNVGYLEDEEDNNNNDIDYYNIDNNDINKNIKNDNCLNCLLENVSDPKKMKI